MHRPIFRSTSPPCKSDGHGPKSGAGSDSMLLIDATLKHAKPPPPGRRAHS
jgi:hypothetical protein